MSKITLGEHSFDQNAKSWRAMVQRDVNVLSVAECVKLFFWVMVFNKILLNEIDNADYFTLKQNDKATV